MSHFECTPDIEAFLKDLPKCEHHVHLEGTLEPQLVFKLAERNKIQLPEFFPKSAEACEDRYNRFKDLQDFLDHYYAASSVLITEEDFYDLAMEYYKRAHKDGCLHSEVFFDPQGHIERGISLETVVNGFNKASQDANESFGTSNKLIMCLLRHLPAQSGLELINDAHGYLSDGTIHGLGLDSAELPFPSHLFTECYSKVAEDHPHIRLTAHAGEEGDHTYVKSALDDLRVTRIDHGVRTKESPELLKRVAQEKIMLTMCPMSNVKLNVVENVGQLPIRHFFDSNVRFSINSDDPAYFGGYILDNYKEVHKHFGFSHKEWAQIARNSIEGSWCDDKRKEELLAHVEVTLNKYDPTVV